MNEQQDIRLLLVDDAELFRTGLRGILESESGLTVVDVAETDQSAVALCRETLPDAAIVAWDARSFCARDTVARLQYARPQMRVLVLAAFADESVLRAAFTSGASGLTAKSATREQLVADLRRLCSGRLVIPEAVLRAVMADYLARKPMRRDRGEGLTAREQEVLRHLSTGASNREISAALCISPNTVQNHVVNILRKLGLENRAQATAYAVRRSLTASAGNGERAGAARE